MPPLLPRFLRRQLERDEHAAVERAVNESVVPTTTAAGSTAAGDRARMRGLPMLGPGVSGTAPGTQPLGALLRKEARDARGR